MTLLTLISSDAVGNLRLIFHYAGVEERARPKQYLKLISSVHEGCDLPVQTSPCVRVLNIKGDLLRGESAFTQHVFVVVVVVVQLWELLVLCPHLQIDRVLARDADVDSCFQVKWRQRARRMTTTTMTAKRAPWTRCVSLSCSIIIILLSNYISGKCWHFIW